MTISTLEQLIDQVDKLSPDDKQKLMDYLDAEFVPEDEILSKVLRDKLKEDGTIDFDALYQSGKMANQLRIKLDVSTPIFQPNVNNAI
jgi:hypothetical protein